MLIIFENMLKAKATLIAKQFETSVLLVYRCTDLILMLWYCFISELILKVLILVMFFFGFNFEFVDLSSPIGYICL